MFYTSLNSCSYKLKFKKTLRLPSRLIMMHINYYWNIQRAATFFPGVKCPGGRDLKKCQIPAYLGLNSCQMPGGCPGEGGGGWVLMDLTHT